MLYSSCSHYTFARASGDCFRPAEYLKSQPQAAPVWTRTAHSTMSEYKSSFTGGNHHGEDALLLSQNRRPAIPHCDAIHRRNAQAVSSKFCPRCCMIRPNGVMSEFFRGPPGYFPEPYSDALYGSPGMRLLTYCCTAFLGQDARLPCSERRRAGPASSVEQLGRKDLDLGGY
jgi:hypothetical protein